LKPFFIVNPQSGSGRTGKRWVEVHAQIARKLPRPEYVFTKEPLDAAKIASGALKEGYDCIVAVGGDGTVNEVVNGFFDCGAPINPRATLAVVPQGTGGDFRKTFGWDLSARSAIERLTGNGAVPIDIGLAEYVSDSGQTERRYFANVCSFGASGVVDREVKVSPKVLGGKVSFVWASLKALIKYSDQRVRLSVDDHPAEELRVTAVSVANGRYFGGGMCVAPNAEPSDGLFDVTIWSGFGLADFVLKSKALYSGTHIRLPGTRCLRCRTLKGESDQEVLIDLDGEPVGRLPCRMTLLPQAIRLKVGAVPLNPEVRGRDQIAGL
jgi:YegS/Rv2252/BmrU family lipid kinase